MKYNFLLQLFFLLLISCQNTSKDNTNEAYDPFNMTNSEMDKLMACSFIMIYKSQKDKDIIIQFKDLIHHFKKKHKEKYLVIYLKNVQIQLKKKLILNLLKI